MIHFNTIHLFQIGNISIPSYTAIMMLAVWIPPLCFVWKAIKKNLPKKHVIVLFLIFLFGAQFGPHFLYELFRPLFYPNYTFFQKSFLETIIEMFSFWKGGLISYGAIIFPFFFLIIYTKKNKNLSWKKIVDIGAPFIPLGFSIQRVACLLNGCCFGLPTNLPWGIVYNQTSHAFGIFGNTPIHPTQAYLLIGNLIIFLILLRLEKIKDNTESINFDGSLFFIFLVLYSAENFFIDSFRYYPLGLYVGPLNFGQIGCFLTLIWAAYFLLKGQKEKSLQSS